MSSTLGRSSILRRLLFLYANPPSPTFLLPRTEALTRRFSLSYSRPDVLHTGR